MPPWIPDISNSSGYRYRALAEAIQDEILSEKLKPGTNLLAHREMSWRLGVTIGTVAKAYNLHLCIKNLTAWDIYYQLYLIR